MIIISRQARRNLNASFFHVMIQGHKKEYIFQKKEYIYEYLKLIKKYIKETDIKVIAYCVMNNHVHFIFKCKNTQELSKFMQKVNTSYAVYYNHKEEGRVGHVYRDRFLSERITTKKYLIECIKYIHFNPVKARMVNSCSEYQFSSYNYFCKRLSQNKFIEELTKDDYENICKSVNYNISFLDVDRDTKETISLAIREFLGDNNYELYEIYEKRQVLKEMILYLKNDKKVKYTEIENYFEITRGIMQRVLGKNNNS